jgi:hypothetical protein
MAVDSIAAGLAPQISGAIRQAARSTGVSFEYLVTTAQLESGFNPAAQARTSSAKGLYQFIEQTWLSTVKQDGAALGLGRAANAISQTADGRYDIADPKARDAIMKLRTDPTVSALMAGAFARNNAAQLQAAIGRQPTEGELYAAHFLGSDGAGKLINAARSHPRANAAEMFPQAAAANPSIFYDGAGRARTASGVYSKLTAKFEVARTVAFASGLRGTLPATGNAARRAPDTAGVTQVLAQANDDLPPLPDTKPLFQAMFTDRARAAVSGTVTGLWAPSAAPAASADKPVNPLDLFTDTKTDVRGMFGGKA